MSDLLKSQGRKELALSLKPTFWTLAQCVSIAHTYLKIVDSKVSPNRMGTDSMMVSVSRGVKKSEVSQITCTDGSSWPPVEGEGAKALTALLRCECGPVLYPFLCGFCLYLPVAQWED